MYTEASLLSQPWGPSQFIPKRFCQAFMEMSKVQPCSGLSHRPQVRPSCLEAFGSQRGPARDCAPSYTLCQGRLLQGHVGHKPSIAFTCGAPCRNQQLPSSWLCCWGHQGALLSASPGQWWSKGPQFSSLTGIQINWAADRKGMEGCALAIAVL